MKNHRTLKKLIMAAAAIVLCLALGLAVFAADAGPESVAPSAGSVAGTDGGNPSAPGTDGSDTNTEQENLPTSLPEDDTSASDSGEEAESEGGEDTPEEPQNPPGDESTPPQPEDENDTAQPPEDNTGTSEAMPPEENTDQEQDDVSQKEGEAEVGSESDPLSEQENAEMDEVENTPEEDVVEEGERTVPYGLVLSESSIVVYSYAELKTALSENNGYTTVYLGGHITGESGGITIHQSKPNVVIDGSPPDGGRYTYTQFLSASDANSIRVANASIQSVTLRNLDITGNNHYGVVYVPEGVAGVTIVHENVNYTGPQAFHNRGGTVRILGGSYNMVPVTGQVVAEVAEAKHAVFGGSVGITVGSTTNGLLWLVGSGSTLTLLEGADVTVDTSYYFLYTGGNLPDVTFEADAKFSLTSRRFGFTYAGDSVGSLILNSGAGLYIHLNTIESYAALRVARRFQMEPNSAATILRTGTDGVSLRLAAAGAQVVLNQPRRVFFYSTAGVPMRFTGTGTLSITTQALNLWKSTTWPLAEGLESLPSHIWNKADDTALTINAGYNTTVQTLTHNLSPDDPVSSALNANSFDLEHTQLLSLGVLSLGIDTPTAQSPALSGGSTPGALLQAAYTLADGQGGTVGGSAGMNGTYSLPIEGGALAVGSRVDVVARHTNLLIVKTATVQDASQYRLSFLAVPQALDFGAVPVPQQSGLLGRQSAGFHFTVQDTRLSPTPWRIDASLSRPLSAGVGAGQSQLPNAVVFKTPNGQLLPLNEVPTTIYRQSGGEGGAYELDWSEEEGVLLQISPGEVYSGVSYSTVIHWSLVDAP